MLCYQEIQGFSWLSRETLRELLRKSGLIGSWKWFSDKLRNNYSNMTTRREGNWLLSSTTSAVSSLSSGLVKWNQTRLKRLGQRASDSYKSTCYLLVHFTIVLLDLTVAEYLISFIVQIFVITTSLLFSFINY